MLQAQPLGHDSGLQSPSQSTDSQSLKMTLRTMRTGKLPSPLLLMTSFFLLTLSVTSPCWWTGDSEHAQIAIDGLLIPESKAVSLTVRLSMQKDAPQAKPSILCSLVD